MEITYKIRYMTKNVSILQKYRNFLIQSSNYFDLFLDHKFLLSTKEFYI